MRGVIIGGGLAGLTFGWLLRRHHPEIDFRLLDRRERLGGRVYTAKGVERGAEFVNGDHYTVQRVCKELDVELERTYNNPEEAPKIASLRDGILRTDFKDLITTLVRAVQRDRNLIKAHEIKSYFDNLSALDYVRQMGLSEEGARFLLLFLETEQGIKSHRMSASFIIEFMDFETLEEGDNSLFAAGDDCFRMANGSSSLVDALALTFQERINQGRAVEGLRVTSSGQYWVFCEGEAPLMADFVVLAIPGPAIRTIRFMTDNEGLADLRRQLLRLRYSDVEKIIVDLDGERLPALQEFQQVLSHEAKGLVWETRGPAANRERSRIAIYRGGGNVGHQEKGRNQNETIRNLIKDLSRAGYKLEHRWHPVPIMLDASVELWPEGGFAQPTRGRGADFRCGTPMRHGNVFVIGEHMARTDPQTMEGAMESAERAFGQFEQHFFSSSLRKHRPQ
jgi:monoamine oxidase